MKTLQIYIFTALISFLAMTTQVFSQDKIYDTDRLLNNETVHEVLIYPNPSLSDKFNVKSEDLIVSVEVLNVIGQRVAKVVNTTGVPYNMFVNIPDCEAGIYMVRITFADKKKIIKKIMVK